MKYKHFLICQDLLLRSLVSNFIGYPEDDKTTEQLGSFIHSYEIIQKTRTMLLKKTRTVLLNCLHSMEYKSGVDSKLKESIKKEIKHLTQMEENLEKEMEAKREQSRNKRRPKQSAFYQGDRCNLCN